MKECVLLDRDGNCINDTSQKSLDDDTKNTLCDKKKGDLDSEENRAEGSSDDYLHILLLDDVTLTSDINKALTLDLLPLDLELTLDRSDALEHILDLILDEDLLDEELEPLERLEDSDIKLIHETSERLKKRENTILLLDGQRNYKRFDIHETYPSFTQQNRK